MYSAWNATTGQYVSTYTPNAYLTLTSELTFSTKSGPMTVTAVMVFSAGALGGLTLTTSENPGILLESFSDWAGGDLSLGLPDPSLFDPSQYLTLDGVTFTFLLSTPTLLGFSTTVSTSQEWVVIPNLLTVQDVSLFLASTFVNGSTTISGRLEGTILLGSDPPVSIDVSGNAPNYFFYGELTEGTTVNVSNLIAYLIPEAVDIPQITLEYFEFSCQPSSTSTIYSLDACFSSDWTLAIGPTSMSITQAVVTVSYGPTASGGASATTGSMGGTIVFNSDITFTVTYAIPGSFSVRGQIPSIDLTALIAELVNLVMQLPEGFDLTFSNCFVALCYGSGGQTLSFQVSADMDGFGAIAFEAFETGGQWGYAAGLSVGSAGISAVPGLSALAPFDSFFSFEELVLVVSTTAMSGFVFPVVPPPSGTTSTTSPTGTVVLPPSQSVVEGLTAYAQVDLSTAEEPGLQLMFELFNLSAALSVTVQVGLTSVASNSSVTAAIVGEINDNLQVAGSMGASLIGDNVSLNVQGTLTVVINGQTLVFAMLFQLQVNGALLSGSYTGTIDFYIVKLSNVILEIGMDFEEIPSIGFGAQVDTAVMESSVMVLLDSVIPTQSMFIGSVSEISLGIFLENVCGELQQQPPSDLVDTLNVVNIGGTSPFTITDTSDTLANELNDYDVAAVSAAFATVGIVLPSSTTQVIISVASSSSQWFVTDMVKVLHYTLTKAGTGEPVNGMLDPQVYAVPQTTQLGTTVVPAGFTASGALNLFGFSATLGIVILPQQGFSIEATFTPLVIAVSGYPIFSLTGSASDSNTGAALSVCTYTNSSTGAQPHFDLTGYMSVLGAVAAGVVVNFTATGGSFTATANLTDVATCTLTGTYGAAFNFAVSGSADIGVNQTLDFGALGQVAVNLGVNCSFSVAVTSPTEGSAGAGGGFTFESISFSIPNFSLPIDSASLAALPNEIVSQVQAALQLFLNDSASWLAWLGNGIVTGITGGAEQVGQILDQSFTLAYDDIATQTTDILNYTTDQVTQALQGAGATADETYDVLVNTLGVPAEEATAAVETFFTGGDHFDVAHGDSTGAHVDTGHTDTVTDHVDTNDHVDTGHDDTVTDHVDTNDHVDTGHDDTKTDHVDTQLTHDDAFADTVFGGSHTDDAPHDDSALHTDLPHDDTSTSHDDTSLHTDLPHDDTSLSHDDTSAHTDLPHDDTSAHGDVPHTDGPA